MNIKKLLSGSLKIFVLTSILGLSANITLGADNPRDFINRNNYLPGGKYRLFGNGRGAVTDLRGNVLSQGTIAFNTGPIQTTVTSFSGKIEYNQEFHNHGWRVHSPFSSSASRSFDSKKGSPATGGQTVTNFNIQASEVHPADGYDGEQGGGYPTPTGARDEYTYLVNGTVRTIRVVNPDKPQPPKSDNKPNNPYNNKGSDSGNNGQPENNSGDTDRNHDLAGSDNPNMPNGSPDGGNDALADNGELKQQQDITKNDNGDITKDNSHYYGDNGCYSDCVIRLNDPTQQYGGQLTPIDYTSIDNQMRKAVLNGDITAINNLEAASQIDAATANHLRNLAQLRNEVPTKLIGKNGKIDMSRFTKPASKNNAKPDWVDPKTGWRISPDKAGANSHRSDYKLIDKKGKRVATLSKDGRVLRK